jgi:hypothetical protein
MDKIHPKDVKYMAVHAKDANTTTVIIKYQVGITPLGIPVIRWKKLTRVKATATNQDIYDVVAALFSLSEYPVFDVKVHRHPDLL